VLVGPHPDTPHDVVGTPDLGVVVTGLPFVTVDFALRADGVWRVVEMGDGQVSDRPVTVGPEVLVSALFATLS
jgi:hypothetical protein